jgi:hypothetical protein
MTKGVVSGGAVLEALRETSSRRGVGAIDKSLGLDHASDKHKIIAINSVNRSNTRVMSSRIHDLPVELWRHIFEYAIHDAKLLDPLYDSPAPSVHQRQQEQQQRQAKYDRLGHLRHSRRTSSVGQLGDMTSSDDNDSSNEANGPSSYSGLALTTGSSTEMYENNHGGRQQQFSSMSMATSTAALRLKIIRNRMSVDRKTKLAIVSTSSQLRKIGLPYLFQSVALSSLRQLELLTALVRASRYRYVPGPHNIKLLREGKGTGYGVFIRRIETRIDRTSFLFSFAIVTDFNYIILYEGYHILTPYPFLLFLIPLKILLYWN